MHQNSPDLSDPRSSCASWHICRGCHVCTAQICIATTHHTADICVKTKGRNGRSSVDNNALRGHMIPVPVFGFCHCSPERRFCLIVVNHLNNARRSLSPSTSLVYKYPPRRPNHTLHPFRVLPSRYPFVFGFLFQASVSLGQS